jgi:fatty-acyl-CoA synthase
MIPLIDSLDTHARARPRALACVDLESGRRWDYAGLDREVNRAAQWVIVQFGPASGARIATLARNSDTLLIAHLACIRAGAIFTPFNWRLALPEVQELIADADPSLLLHDLEFAVEELPVSRVSIPDFRQAVAAQPLPGSTPKPRAADSVSTLLYTSGTTGKPKGVMVTEANAFWGSLNFNLGNDVTIRSVFLCDMPMFHTAGLFAAIRSPLLAGGAVLISRGFDAPKTLERLADASLGITHYFSVPQMARALWLQPNFDSAMLKRLTVYAMGGAPNPAAQIERFVRDGIPMSDGFGMSETCSNFGMPFHDPALLLAKAGSCGLPYASLQARIVDTEGSDVTVGERGELWLKGPSVTPGYWNKPELTALAFADGWFKTGDAAMRDADGFYYLIDRKKDMFISGGENVYPAEVEGAIGELDAVAEVAVIGVPDARWGEVGRAYIVVRPGHRLEADAILEHCRSRLAGYKKPASIIFTDTIPRTSSGKIQKQILKDRARVELS